MELVTPCGLCVGKLFLNRVNIILVYAQSPFQLEYKVLAYGPCSKRKSSKMGLMGLLLDTLYLLTTCI